MESKKTTLLSKGFLLGLFVFGISLLGVYFNPGRSVSGMFQSIPEVNAQSSGGTPVPTAVPVSGLNCQVKPSPLPPLAMCGGMTATKNNSNTSFDTVIRGDVLSFNCFPSSNLLTTAVIKQYRNCLVNTDGSYVNNGANCGSQIFPGIGVNGDWSFQVDQSAPSGHYKVECQLCLKDNPSICSDWGKTKQIDTWSK